MHEHTHDHEKTNSTLGGLSYVYVIYKHLIYELQDQILTIIQM